MRAKGWGIPGRWVLVAWLAFPGLVAACLPPPDCGDCKYWDGDSCELVGTCVDDYDCSACQSCTVCYCWNDCRAGETCCESTNTCCPAGRVCCNGTCCPAGEVCCNGTTCCPPGTCCYNGSCYSPCNPSGGGPCAYPPLSAPSCSFKNIDDPACADPGEVCGWVVSYGPEQNAACPPCNPGCTRNADGCVLINPKLCENCLTPYFPFYGCCCSGSPGLLPNYPWGSHAVCN
jgi:hypothetical protein